MVKSKSDKRIVFNCQMCVLVGIIIAIVIVTLAIPIVDEPSCPKYIYEVKGDGSALAKDCNEHEWRGIPPRYGVIRVWQVGEVG